jgi:hypothetical protein
MSSSTQPGSRPRVTARTSGAVLATTLPPLFYLVLAALFLGRSTFTGDVFLPAGLLGYFHPYNTRIHAESLPPWNPLRWDGIAQFYPWRHFAATAIHSGRLPLWNPYQLCGTPFVANSQSAVFYPGNLLFYLLPTAQAFNWSAVLHLTFCGWFTFLLLRAMDRSTPAALLGGMIFAYSSWQVAWLQLPTFLATSCWCPLLLRQIYRADRHASLRSALTIAPVVGMMLLAGHLQIAFYGLLAGALWTLTLALGRLIHGASMAAVRLVAIGAIALCLGLMFAAPQLIPTLELSRRSHRVGTPTAAGYRAYTEYSLPIADLVMLTLPDFYGNDHDPQNPYWGFYTLSFEGAPSLAIRHNAAETAIYVGVVPLLLAGLALFGASGNGVGWRNADRRVWFFGALALLALLLALGTPLNALFYFGIPGFGQSGSPARALMLWALSLGVLAAFGLDSLRAIAPTRLKAVALAIGIATVTGAGIALAAQALSTQIVGIDRVGFGDRQPPVLGEVLAGRLGMDWMRLGAMAALGLLILMPPARNPLFAPSDRDLMAPWRRMPKFVFAALLITGLDLFSVGFLNNPTAAPDWVYPETPGVRYLREHIGHDRIMPLNHRWNLLKPPASILPPNGAMAYDLRDVQGYDSLLIGRYKAFANRFARQDSTGRRDASPPEVGNMIFFQDASGPDVSLLGASLGVTVPTDSPEFTDTVPPSSAPIQEEADELAVYALNTSHRARFIPDNGSQTLPVAFGEDTPTRVSLDVDAPSNGTLVLADSIYPGWRVTIDGRTSALLSGFPDAVGIFRAVHVNAGHHRVAFRYEPHAFRVGLYLALFALLLHLAWPLPRRLR